MFAVIKTGGKQYRVQKGDVLEVEKLDADNGKTITFDEVLLVESDGKTSIGTPLVKNASVKAEVVDTFKDKKVLVFKKKKRKQYRRTRGHRQELTRIRIESILFGPAKSDEKSETKPAEAKTTAKPAAQKVSAAKKPAAKKPAAKTTAVKKPAAKPAAPKKVTQTEK
ncbi:MAG: 50S ribosomal protein L21 [Acidobacteria bacterium]|nr:50S ribosomal protein L21 [Acidobacteriota bacterium]MBU4253221.1 50S ribosomal protein L21 [Acidobacteriota bacterium]